MIPRNLTDKSREQFSWYFKILKALKCNEKTKFNKWKHSIPMLRVRSACWSGSSLSRALDPPSRARVLLVDHRSTGTRAHVTGLVVTRILEWITSVKTPRPLEHLGYTVISQRKRYMLSQYGVSCHNRNLCLLTMIWGKKCLKCEIVSREKSSSIT